MVHHVFNDAFEALLAGWHRYMDVAASTDDAFKLAEARREVDELRDRAYRGKRGVSPEDGLPDESLAAYCPFLATTVYVPTNQVRYTRQDTLEFECDCERRVGYRPRAWLRQVQEPEFTPPVARESTRLHRSQQVTNS